MINNFNKDFFNKNKAGLRLCTIALTGMMVASPFIVNGIVNKTIDDMNQRNKSVAVQEEVEEETSRIFIEFEGEYNEDNSMVIIYGKDDPDGNGKTDILGIVTDSADDPYVDLPAGDYIVSGKHDSHELIIDGENDYSLSIDYETGEITDKTEYINENNNINEQNSNPRTR